MKTSIQACIAQNAEIIGKNFESVGKSVPWHGRKVYLSYNTHNGWEVLQLNIFQRFLRATGFFYRDSHLKHIQAAWKNEKIHDASLKKQHPLNQIIKTLWNKHYYLIARGNSHPEKAKIFCFGEAHGDYRFRKTIANFIDENYKVGDIILVEGCPVGEISLKNKWTRYLKGKDYIVQGWEPTHVNLGKFFLFEATEKTSERIDELGELLADIKTACPENDICTKEELNKLKVPFDAFIAEYPSLAEYFLVPNNEIQVKVKILKRVFSDLEAGELSGQELYGLALIVLQDFANNYEKVLYHHRQLLDQLHDQNLEKLYEEFEEHNKERNKVMCEEIDKGLNAGKKVFVIGGEAHFLTQNAARIKHLAATKSFLKKHPHLIISKRAHCYAETLKITELNSHIREIGLRPLATAPFSNQIN